MLDRWLDGCTAPVNPWVHGIRPPTRQSMGESSLWFWFWLPLTALRAIKSEHSRPTLNPKTLQLVVALRASQSEWAHTPAPACCLLLVCIHPGAYLSTYRDFFEESVWTFYQFAGQS